MLTWMNTLDTYRRREGRDGDAAETTAAATDAAALKVSMLLRETKRNKRKGRRFKDRPPKNSTVRKGGNAAATVQMAMIRSRVGALGGPCGEKKGGGKKGKMAERAAGHGGPPTASPL